MATTSRGEVVCDEHEEAIRSRAASRLDGYRQRLQQAPAGSLRKRVHEDIAQELASEHTSLAACAAALLNSRIGPEDHSEAWKTLKAVRDSSRETTNARGADSATCLRLIAQIAAHWGAKVLDHYAWTARGRSFLERLWRVAELHPDWGTAARYLCVVLLMRHELVLMGKTKGSMRSWQTVGNEADKGSPRLKFSPVTAADLKNVIDWTESGNLNLGAMELQSLCDAEARVHHWVTATAESISLVDGSRLTDRPVQTRSICMLALDAFGLLVREDTLRRRPRRSDIDLIPLSKRHCTAANRLLTSPGTACGLRKVLPMDPVDSLDDASSTAHDLDDAQSESDIEEAVDTGAPAQTPSPGMSLGPSQTVRQDQHGSLLNAMAPTNDEDNDDDDENDQDDGSTASSISDSTNEDLSTGSPSRDETPATSMASANLSADVSNTTRSSDCPYCGGVCVAGIVLQGIDQDQNCSGELPVQRRRDFDAIHEISALAQEHGDQTMYSARRAWTSKVHIASVYHEPDFSQLSTATKDDADVWLMDSDRFLSYASSGLCFDRPIVIRGAVRDAGWYGRDKLLSMLKNRLDGLSAQTRDDETRAVSVAEVLNDVDRPEPVFHHLRLPAIVRGDRPLFTLMSRYRLLEDVLEATARTRTKMYSSTGDLLRSTHSNTVSPRGAFAGAHIDNFNGKWERIFVGRKAWMFVPSDLLTGNDWERLAQDGDHWDPDGRARTIVLEPDDVVFIPPACNVVHAELTLEACITEDAAIWDEKQVTEILRNMFWIVNHQRTTNAPWLQDIQALVVQLDRIVLADPTKFGLDFGCGQGLKDYESALSDIQSYTYCEQPDV